MNGFQGAVDWICFYVSIITGIFFIYKYKTEKNKRKQLEQEINKLKTEKKEA